MNVAGVDLTLTELNPRERELLAVLRALDPDEREQAFRIMDILGAFAVDMQRH